MKPVTLGKFWHDFGDVFAWDLTHTEKLGVCILDPLHVGLALALNATEVLTGETPQASPAKPAGLKERT